MKQPYGPKVGLPLTPTSPTGERRTVTFTDVTDPDVASQRETVRTLADEAGNRYVLLTTAQYLRLLTPRLCHRPLQEATRHGPA